MRVCPKCQSSFPDNVQFCPTDGSALSVQLSPQADPRVGTLIDRYRVVSKLGDGGMGIVYKAEHTHIGRPVALKLLHPDLARVPQAVDRFFREARAANEVPSDHIVQVTDFGQTPDGANFLVMEFLDGASLADVIAEQRRLPAQRVVHIALQLAEALTAAHAKGVIHRDLKPANIQLVKRGAEADYVKVLDFGIAKLVEGGTQLTKTGMIMGSPAYMSPEQASGKHVDARTDIYAFGIILYEMLVGAPPFVGDSATQILLAHLTIPPPAPRTICADIPEGLEQIILACLAKLPEGRPQTMGVVTSMLAAWQQGGAQARPQAALAPTMAPLPASAPLMPMPAPQAQAFAATAASIPGVAVAPAGPAPQYPQPTAPYGVPPTQYAQPYGQQQMPPTGPYVQQQQMPPTGPYAPPAQPPYAQTGPGMLPPTQPVMPAVAPLGAGVTTGYGGHAASTAPRSGKLKIIAIVAVIVGIAGGVGATVLVLRGKGDGGAGKKTDTPVVAKTPARDGAVLLASHTPQPDPKGAKVEKKAPDEKPAAEKKAPDEKPAVEKPAVEKPADKKPVADKKPKAPKRRAERRMTLQLRTDPSGAEVYEGDSSLGVTPVSIPLTGEKSIVLRKAGYKPQHLTVGPQTQSPLNIMLEPKPVAVRPPPQPVYRPPPQPAVNRPEALRAARQTEIQQLKAITDARQITYREYRRRLKAIRDRYRAMGVR